jgi:hypothetical protein
LSALSLWVGAKAGIFQILVATLTLLPGPLAYGLYRGLISTQKPLNNSTRIKRSLRVFGHFVIAFLIVSAIHTYRNSCWSDDDSCYYDDDDQKPESPAEANKNWMRMTILVFGGMIVASRHHKAQSYLSSA